MSVVNIEDAKKPKVTICTKCRHFVTRSEGPMGAAVWYNQFCGHPDVQKPPAVDPVTGKEGYLSRNDLGGTYYAERSEPFARDINNGRCPFFEAVER